MKRILIALAILIATLYLALFAILHYFINSDKAKSMVSKAIYAETGRNAIIKGDVSLGVFPRIHISIADVTIGNPDTIPTSVAPYLVHVGKAEAGIALAPLFSGQMRPTGFRLHHTTVYLVSNTADTHSQVPKQAPTKTQHQQPSHQHKEKDTRTRTASSKPFNINDALFPIDIDHLAVHIVDPQHGQNTTISDAFLNLTPATQSSPLQFKIGMHLINAKPRIDARINASAILQYLASKGSYHLDDARISGQINTFNTTFAHPLPFHLGGKFAYASNTDTFQLSKLSARFGDAVLSGSLTGNRLATPTVDAQLTLTPFSPRQLLQQFGITLPGPPSTWKKVAGTIHVKTHENHCDITPLQLTLDESTLTGAITVTAQKTPSIKADLSIDQLNLDRYLVPTKSHNAQHTPASTTAPQSNKANQSGAITGKDLHQWLSHLQWQQTFHIKQLTYAKQTYRNIQFDTRNHNSKLVIAPVHASLKGGNIDANLTLDASTNNTDVQADINAKRVPVAALTQNNRLFGTLNLATHLHTSGESTQHWISNLSGKGNLHVNNGVIKGISLSHLINQGRRLLPKNKDKALPESRDTRFQAIDAEYSISQGIVSNRALTIASGQFKVHGTGTIALTTQALNYQIMLVYQHDDKKIRIPLLATGSVSAPKFTIDKKRLMKIILEDQAKKIFNQEKGKFNLKELLHKKW